MSDQAARFQIEVFARRETLAVPPEREAWFFASIEKITDHDEATARAILNYGPIVTERYRFSQIPAALPSTPPVGYINGRGQEP